MNTTTLEITLHGEEIQTYLQLVQQQNQLLKRRLNQLAESGITQEGVDHLNSTIRSLRRQLKVALAAKEAKKAEPSSEGSSASEPSVEKTTDPARSATAKAAAAKAWETRRKNKAEKEAKEAEEAKAAKIVPAIEAPKPVAKKK